MSAHRPWDKDAQGGPAWARNLGRRSYLVAREDAADDPDGDGSYEAPHACAVGDVIALAPSVLPPHEDGSRWRIVAQEDADPPFRARLIVVPA